MNPIVAGVALGVIVGVGFLCLRYLMRREHETPAGPGSRVRVGGGNFWGDTKSRPFLRPTAESSPSNPTFIPFHERTEGERQGIDEARLYLLSVVADCLKRGRVPAPLETGQIVDQLVRLVPDDGARAALIQEMQVHWLEESRYRV